MPKGSPGIWKSHRVTIMIDDDLDEIIRVDFGKHVIKCAREHCAMPTWSYSRQINRALRQEIKKWK